ncbi:Copia protein, partial [Mucuna pruriens]
MRELKFFLGLQIKQARDEIYIHQTKYVNKLLKKLNIEDCKTISTPMHLTSILNLDETDKKVGQTSYRGMIDSLIYLTTFRLDIRFNIPKSTTNLGLCYKKFDQYRLKDYNDVGFVGDRIERKNTSGGCHFIGANIVSWSTAQCYSQLLWIKHQLEDYDIIESNIPFLCDNAAAINLSKNLILHSHAIHIEIKHNFIRDYVQKGTLDLNLSALKIN